jgi:DNA-directed RNA polymerase specialized sigma24 family protein
MRENTEHAKSIPVTMGGEPITPPSDTKKASNRRGFYTTRWSLVLNARSLDPEKSERALAELCQSYWYPLYGFVRARGTSPEDAEDLIQGFFEQVLRLDTFSRADEDRGKLRTFLLGSLKKYLANDRAKKNAVKRGGGISVISLDQEWAENQIKLEPADPRADSAAMFERRWAMTLLKTSLEILEDEFNKRGAGEKFEILEPFLLWHQDDDYQSAADDLSISLGATKVAVHRLRKRYREIAREEIAETLGEGENIDNELRHIFSALS